MICMLRIHENVHDEDKRGVSFSRGKSNGICINGPSLATGRVIDISSNSYHISLVSIGRLAVFLDFSLFSSDTSTTHISNFFEYSLTNEAGVARSQSGKITRGQKNWVKLNYSLHQKLCHKNCNLFQESLVQIKLVQLPFQFLYYYV